MTKQTIFATLATLVLTKQALPLRTPKRPLSPHLQVYRPQLTSVLSILHRIAGVIITIGMLFLAWWLYALATGAPAYQIAHDFFDSWYGTALLLPWTLCTAYHLCNGIRHLFWDIGYGFELPTAYLSGKVTVIAAFGLTALAWLT